MINNIELQNILENLEINSLDTNRILDAVSEYNSQKYKDVPEIALLTAEFLGFNWTAIISKTRTTRKGLMEAKHIIRFLLYHYKKMTLWSIAGLFNLDQSSTVINSIKYCRNYYETDLDFREKLNEIKKVLGL